MCGYQKGVKGDEYLARGDLEGAGGEGGTGPTSVTASARLPHPPPAGRRTLPLVSRPASSVRVFCPRLLSDHNASGLRAKFKSSYIYTFFFHFLYVCSSVRALSLRWLHKNGIRCCFVSFSFFSRFKTQDFFLRFLCLFFYPSFSRIVVFTFKIRLVPFLISSFSLLFFFFFIFYSIKTSKEIDDSYS